MVGLTKGDIKMNIFTREFWAIFKEMITQRLSLFIFFNILYVVAVVFMFSIGVKQDLIVESSYYTVTSFYLLILSLIIYESNIITTFYFKHREFIEQHGEEVLKELEKLNKQFKKGE
jgi:ABC-type multidrug transport system fused ATPase/permease subunit